MKRANNVIAPELTTRCHTNTMSSAYELIQLVHYAHQSHSHKRKWPKLFHISQAMTKVITVSLAVSTKFT